MADEKPGTTADAPASQTPVTSPAAPPVVAPDGQNAAATNDPYAEFPEEFREKVKSREEAAKQTTLNEYRAKAGADGGWMSQVSPELREAIKQDPQAFWRYKAEAEAYKSALGGSRAPVEEKKADPAAEVESWLERQIDANPDLTVGQLAKLQFQAADKLARLRSSEIADSRSRETFAAVTAEEREATCKNQPEMKNTFFAMMYKGAKEELKGMGKKADPYEAFAMTREAWKQMFPNAPINQSPAPIPSSADTKRTPAAPAPSTLSPKEEWLRSAAAKAMLRT